MKYIFFIKNKDKYLQKNQTKTMFNTIIVLKVMV
jgi:hypothetical protein